MTTRARTRQPIHRPDIVACRWEHHSAFFRIRPAAQLLWLRCFWCGLQGRLG